MVHYQPRYPFVVVIGTPKNVETSLTGVNTVMLENLESLEDIDKLYTDIVNATEDVRRFCFLIAEDVPAHIVALISENVGFTRQHKGGVLIALDVVNGDEIVNL